MAANTPPICPLRFIVFHIHPLSARLKYLVSSEGSICFPNKLPKLSDLMEGDVNPPKISIFPKSYIEESCEQYKIPTSQLKMLTNFRCWVDTPALPLPLYAMQVVANLPFDAQSNMHWIELPDCFSVIPIEREIMQLIYKWLLE